MVDQPIPLQSAWEHGSPSPYLLHGLRGAGGHAGRQRNQTEINAAQRDSKHCRKRSLTSTNPELLISSTKASTAPQLASSQPSEPSRNLRSSPCLQRRTIKREPSLQSILPGIFNIKLSTIICILGDSALLGKKQKQRSSEP